MRKVIQSKISEEAKLFGLFFHVVACPLTHVIACPATETTIPSEPGRQKLAAAPSGVHAERPHVAAPWCLRRGYRAPPAYGARGLVFEVH